MEYIYIGDIVNTHGIKGELRILADFKYKDLVFKKSFKLYIGKDRIEEIIDSYRYHKIYDMVILKGYDNINQVLKYKGEPVYVSREDLDVPYLNDELIGFEVYDDKEKKPIGKLTEIRLMKNNEILVVDKEILIPNIPQFVKVIDVDKKQIVVETIRGMLNED